MLKIGAKIRVIVTEIDDKGRVNVSAKDLLEKPEGYVDEDENRSRGNKNRNGNRNRNNQRPKEKNEHEQPQEENRSGEVRFFGKK